MNFAIFLFKSSKIVFNYIQTNNFKFDSTQTLLNRHTQKIEN